MHDLQSSQSPQPTSWPTAGGAPISEFTTEGYMTCVFRTLFPTGAADFLAPRVHTVTVGNFFKHLMMYEDRRFSKHPRFCYFALNTEMRWCALQTGRIYVYQHPHDARLSVDEVRDMVGREGEAFSNCVLTLCCQSSWDKAALVQATEQAHFHGRYPRTPHCVLHTQCS